MNNRYKHKVLIITSAAAVREGFPEDLCYMEVKGVYVHQLHELGVLIEEIRKKFMYLVIDEDLYEIQRNREAIVQTLAFLPFPTKILTFTGARILGGLQFTVRDSDYPWSIENFVDTVIKGNLVHAATA
jgi:hypothetical protein